MPARLIALALAVLAVAGCTIAPRTRTATGKIEVVAAESFWGSLAAQLGGDRVSVRSIVDNPDADPHDYEPVTADARAIANAALVVVNGVGYDPWASRLVAANPSRARRLIDVGKLVAVRTGGNPHRWYNPQDVAAVIDAITAAYQKIQPDPYFSARHQAVLGGALKPYFDLISEIKTRFSGTPVGASESIFAMLAPALGLRLLTPESFLDAISEGGEPTAADKIAIDRQIRQRQIKVYVYNSQNATPDIQRQADAARAAGIPVTAITETPAPAGVSFQDWQVGQLTALRQALAGS